jgi:RNA polymerase sigma-70 factor (ECF subfamily)
LTAAYESAPFASAAVQVDVERDRVTPEPPQSGIKSLVVPRDPASAPSPLATPAERAREFRRLYDAEASFVWRNLRRLGVMDRDVDDKCQEVFVVAYRRWDDFVDRGHGSRAWLFQIVLRVASDARRHRRRHPVDPDGGIAQDRQSVEAPQAVAVARKQALDLLDRALSSLDMGRRAVLVLHEIEQMTAPEIARALEIPINTVYSRLRAARIELDAELARLSSADTARDQEGRP